MKESELIQIYEDELKNLDTEYCGVLHKHLLSAITFLNTFKNFPCEPIVYIDDDLCFCFDFIGTYGYLSISLGLNGKFHWARVYKNLENKRACGSCDFSSEYDKCLLEKILSDFNKI